ncbi:hypothetical protein PDO_2828 [Rhizobium sp. PDO1-076]|uniref:DUF6455 family protein n=1 Tax=Rhizobium sp. PDO1-076 TaxID=1125979 RepID=UPI00024E2236|nr:DUF6455 family protein [Rhizobium sp. PDO1-076]EHS50007.1 hypothetical protein PDO_2828 [Rhizobium sp. PDO1-076]
MTLAIAEPIRQSLTQILSWFARSFEASAEADILAAMDEREIMALAEDCGISPDQLLVLIKAGPHGADEMPQMMRALNIDPAEVELRMRKLFRHMQTTCAACGAKDRCRRDLVHAVADQSFMDYCGNAETLNALRADPDLLAER